MIRAKKSLGQNFLIDASVSRRIVETVKPGPRDLIIEIGPGTGALTRLLVERAGYVVAIEVDRRLVEELNRSIAASNLSIIEADALALDWNELIEQATGNWRQAQDAESAGPRLRIVANLPYYISTAIIERLISLRRRLFDMTLMLQKEVIDRMTSGPGSRDYGYLSVMVQFYARTEKLFEVAPASFTPAPKVQSAVVRIVLRDNPAVEVSDEKRFFALVGAAFAQRRKTILNNLKAARATLSFTNTIEDGLNAAGLHDRRRAETFSLEEFGALYCALYGEQKPVSGL